MTKNTNVTGQLADLAVLQSRTDADEKKILDAAVARHDELQGQLGQAGLDARRGDDAAGNRYQAIVAELGQVNIVIGKARAALE
jgi:hypothetical protein